jgi:hypothetical protein
MQASNVHLPMVKRCAENRKCKQGHWRDTQCGSPVQVQVLILDWLSFATHSKPREDRTYQKRPDGEINETSFTPNGTTNYASHVTTRKNTHTRQRRYRERAAITHLAVHQAEEPAFAAYQAVLSIDQQMPNTLLSMNGKQTKVMVHFTRSETESRKSRDI